jgi:phosphoribosylglycinamide formyltransferase-1
MSEQATPRVAILASGGGTTAEAYIRAIHEGVVKAEVGLVIASSFEAGILEKVPYWNRDFGLDIETQIVNELTHPLGAGERGQTDEESSHIAGTVRDRGIGLVALLGYMRIVRGELMEEYGYLPGTHTSLYQARMVNTHPGPLPETADTYGIGTSQRVLDLGLLTSKHTVHVVAPGVDKGPVIVAHDVPVHPHDTARALNNRTQLIEKATIAYALDKFLREQHEYRSSLSERE